MRGKWSRKGGRCRTSRSRGSGIGVGGAAPARAGTPLERAACSLSGRVAAMLYCWNRTCCHVAPAQGPAGPVLSRMVARAADVLCINMSRRGTGRAGGTRVQAKVLRYAGGAGTSWVKGASRRSTQGPEQRQARAIATSGVSGEETEWVWVAFNRSPCWANICTTKGVKIR